MVTINRFILLDPLMMFFISATVYSMTKFQLLRDKYCTFAYFIYSILILTNYIVCYYKGLLVSCGGLGYR